MALNARGMFVGFLILSAAAFGYLDNEAKGLQSQCNDLLLSLTELKNEVRHNELLSEILIAQNPEIRGPASRLPIGARLEDVARLQRSHEFVCKRADRNADQASFALVVMGAVVAAGLFFIGKAQ